MYTQLISHLIFPLQERLKKHTTVAVHKRMEASQWWSAAQLHPVERLAWIWVVFNEKAYDEIKLLPNCMPIRNEDICHNPVVMSRQLFGFCELAWSPQTEKFLAESTARNVDRYYSIVKNPAEAAQKWRKQLDPEDIERVMSVVSRTEIGQLYMGNSWAHG